MSQYDCNLEPVGTITMTCCCDRRWVDVQQRTHLLSHLNTLAELADVLTVDERLTITERIARKLSECVLNKC